MASEKVPVTPTAESWGSNRFLPHLVSVTAQSPSLARRLCDSAAAYSAGGRAPPPLTEEEAAIQGVRVGQEGGLERRATLWGPSLGCAPRWQRRPSPAVLGFRQVYSSCRTAFPRGTAHRQWFALCRTRECEDLETAGRIPPHPPPLPPVSSKNYAGCSSYTAAFLWFLLTSWDLKTKACRPLRVSPFLPMG